MNLPAVFRCGSAKIVCFGLLAFSLLTIRFSPNWLAFYQGVEGAKVHVADPAQRAAIDKAILSSYSARGFYVAKQARNLNATIDDPRHKIVRWRLFIPALGHFLHLPVWLVLGLAQVGCMALVLALVAIGAGPSAAAGRPPYEAACLGVVAGASAPFFTSMGLLGYYDSLLALTLLGAAFARPRWVVWLACLVGPWVDERFVLGLPLALCVRAILAEVRPGSRWAWCREQAAIPVLLAGGYALIRLRLGGTGGSQTVGAYMNQFVWSERLSPGQLLVGAWAGLRVAWVLVTVAFIRVLRPGVAVNRLEALLLSAGIALTGLIGLFTALDLGRSMVLLLPAVPLGWIWAARSAGWGRLYLAPLLAAAALLLPADHVVGRYTRSVDNFWTPSRPLLMAQNDLGLMYDEGDGVPRDRVEAMKWYRRAAEQGSPEAQHNLAVLYASGKAGTKDSAEALRWYRRSAEQGFAQAQYNLGMLYAEGDGVPRDGAEALKWLRRAAEQNHPEAQFNLGVMYANGAGVARDGAKAARWYRRAAALGYAEAANNLGVMYATGHGVAKDLIQACRWLRLARSLGSAGAQKNLAIVEAAMTPEEVAAAAALAGERLEAPSSDEPPPPDAGR